MTVFQYIFMELYGDDRKPIKFLVHPNHAWADTLALRPSSCMPTPAYQCMLGWSSKFKTSPQCPCTQCTRYDPLFEGGHPLASKMVKPNEIIKTICPA